MQGFDVNNDKPTNKPILLKCLECRSTWSPYGRGGVNACPDCGTGVLDYTRRKPFESSYRIVRVA